MKLEDFLKKEYNYNPEAKDIIQTYVDQWKSWYAGNVKSFHNYFVYNGQMKVPQVRYTLNMAKQISEEWSDILWSEKCKVSFDNENTQKEYDDLVDELNLNVIINQAIEKSGALGTIATVVSVYDIKASDEGMTLDVSEAKTRIDIVDVDQIYPLSWNNKEVTECAFGSVQYINGQKYVILSVHKIGKDKNYVIKNHLFRDNNDQLSEVAMNDNTFIEFPTKSNKKWFSIFKPLLTNNLFNNSPFGIPHYANAIDSLKAVDICFDEIKNEITNARRRMFVRAELLNYSDGQQKLTFDPNDVTFYVLPDGANKDDLLQSDSEQLRTNQQIETLNTNLNILGDKVGFGENHYHFDGQNLSTATAVVSSNSKLFRRKKKLEIGYESSIYDLVQAVCYVSSKFGHYNINAENIVIQFDDSIVEDKETESNRAMREVSAGLLSKEEYREKIFGETPEIAKQKIEEIEKSQPDVENLFGETKEDKEEQEVQEEDKEKDEDEEDKKEKEKDKDKE